MQLVKIETSLQLADIFTKPLPYPQFLECLRGILCLTVACGYVGMASMEAPGRHQSGT